MANNKTMKEVEIETLTRRIQKLRIELSEAEAQLARKKEQMANKGKMRTNANTELSTNGVMANKEKININTEAEGKADVVMVPGDRVMITWDKYWQWNRSTRHMPKTQYEGSKGTVIRTSECFVWVELDDTHIALQKRKHNVKLVAGEKN
jgi:hypothetical protein